jgi:beta-glucosidase
VIGLNADCVVSGGGSSRLESPYWVTPLAGLKAKLGDDVDVVYEPGYDNRVDPKAIASEQFTHPDGVTHGLKAEYFNALDFDGQPVFERVDANVDHWWVGVSPEQGVVSEKQYCVRWTGTFTAPDTGETEFRLKNTGYAKVWLDGELLIENGPGVVPHNVIDTDKIIVHQTIKLEKGKEYKFKATFVSGEANPFAWIQFSYLPPLGVEGDLVGRAVKLAKSSDAAVIIAGWPDSYESEGRDRPDMKLTGAQEPLIRAVAQANPNTVVVLNVGAPVTMPWIEAVDAVVLAYYPGQEGGHALADLLFGDVNPSGKLTVTFPKRLEDNPAFMHYPGGKDVHYGERFYVGYRYYDTKLIEPLFPFGHGLSYTEFNYSELALPQTVKKGEKFQVMVTVENTGEVFGQEVIQLYIRDIETSVLRPLKELKGFEKLGLAPGESKIVTFDLDTRALSYFDDHVHQWVAKKGMFEVLVGASSKDIRLRGIFELE